MTFRILIVEDNLQFGFGMSLNLEVEGYLVEHVADGLLAVQILEEQTFDLVILDLMLPGMNGIDVLRHIRRVGLDLPVMVVTALHAQTYWLRALKLGADAYIEKPLPNLAVFLAQVEALLRRGSRFAMSAAQVAAAEGEFGTDVPVDPTGGRGLYVGGRFIAAEATGLQHGGEVVQLTPKEHELLLYLVTRVREVVSHNELLRGVWGFEPGMNIETGTLKDTIYRIRQKLEKDPKHPVHIKTVRGIGYRFDP